MWKVGIAVLLVLLITSGAWAQEDKFKVYGFMDVNYIKYTILKDESFVRQFGSKDHSFSLGNVNAYFDFKPGDNVRGLVELGFNDGAYNHSGSNGTKFVTLYNGVDLQTAIAGLQAQAAGLRTQAAAATAGAATFAGFGLTDSAAYYTGLAAQANAGADQYDGAAVGLAAGAAGLSDSEAKDTRRTGGVTIERAWLELYLNDHFTLRSGKFITPAGIWNVDHGSPIITTIGQPNQTDFFPIFPIAQTGVMVYGAHWVGDHELGYTGYISTGREDEPGSEIGAIEKVTDFAVGGHVSFKNEEIIDKLEIGASGYGGTLRDKYMEMEITVDFADPNKVAIMHNDVVQYEGREIALGADLKVSHMNINLQSELNYRAVTNEFGGPGTEAFDGKETTYLAYYALVSYDLRLTDNISLTPYAFYEHIGWEDPENQPYSTLASYPLIAWDQYMFGLNFGLFSNLHWKVEYVYGTIDEQDPAITANNYSGDDLTFARFQTQLTMAF